MDIACKRYLLETTSEKFTFMHFGIYLRYFTDSVISEDQNTNKTSCSIAAPFALLFDFWLFLLAITSSMLCQLQNNQLHFISNKHLKCTKLNNFNIVGQITPARVSFSEPLLSASEPKKLSSTYIT